jgi:hypothetical protein
MSHVVSCVEKENLAGMVSSLPTNIGGNLKFTIKYPSMLYATKLKYIHFRYTQEWGVFGCLQEVPLPWLHYQLQIRSYGQIVYCSEEKRCVSNGYHAKIFTKTCTCVILGFRRREDWLVCMGLSPSDKRTDLRCCVRHFPLGSLYIGSNKSATPIMLARWQNTSS